MDENIRVVYWEAPEHNHIEKTSDWFWILGIIALAGSIASIMLGNVLFGIVILLAAFAMYVVSHRKPHVIPFEVSGRGVRINQDLYPYATLETYYVDEENPTGPQLLLKSKKLFVPLLILPIPEEYVDDIEGMLAGRLHEEHLEEPLSHRVLEFFGF